MKQALILLLMLIMPFSLNAQDEFTEAEMETDDFDEMSLESILEMKLVTATQKEQTAAEAPAILSVLTAEQIQQLGITTLYEALDFLPGVQVSESFFGYTMVNMRGILQTHYNNKVLLLINGHPMREVINGSFHLEIVPIQAIERIEVIRGPGSALYGTNAFAGVINIITRTAKENERLSAQLGGGSFSTWEAALNFGQKLETFEYFISASTRNDQGYPFNVEQDEKGASDTLDYENDLTNFFGSVKVDDFTFSAAFFDQTKQKFGITPVLSYTGPSDYQGGFVDLEWQHALNEHYKLKARLRYDEIEKEFEIGQFPYPGFQGHECADTLMLQDGQLFGSEINLDYTPNAKFSLLSGIVYEHYRTDPYLFKFKDDHSIHPNAAYYHSKNADDLSLFTQGLLFFTEKSHIVLGLRYNNNSDSGTSIVPRAGLVFEISPNTFIKALYAEAYRSPDFFEKNVETYDVLYGSSDLDPEKVKSFDLALDTTLKQKFNFNVDVFYLTTDELVTRVPTSDPKTTGDNASEYVNLGGQNIWGLEASVLAPLTQKARLLFNYSYQTGENKETELEGQTEEIEKDLIFIAEHTVNAVLSWKVNPWLSINPSLQYVSERGEVDPYFLANLVLILPVHKHVSLSLIGKNLTDEDYTYPEYIRNNIDEIPGGPERSFFIRANLTF
ncbi:TonB-dependent receptor [bacterium]|nr:TonB-dependent receptor [bacterium]